MQRFLGGVVVICCSGALVSCATIVAAPGANQVRVTHNPAEVTHCTPVGNINLPPREQGLYAGLNFRNRVVGFGGNTGLVTTSVLASEPIDGIAYRCPATTIAGASLHHSRTNRWRG